MLRFSFIFIVSLLYLYTFSSFSQQSQNIEAGYLDGFFLKTPDDRFKLKLGSRVNLLYAAAFNESAPNSSSFDLVHAKLYAGGHFYSPKYQYFIQAAAGDFSSYGPAWNIPSESSGGAFVLEDYYVRAELGKTYIQMGQFKVPFSRQWMIYSGNLSLPFRSPATHAFSFGRDRGILISHYNETFWLSLGIFNGSGSYGLNQNGGLKTSWSNAGAPNATGHLYLLRVTAIPLGTAGFEESDIEMNPRTRVELGASVVYDHNRDLDLNRDAIAEESGTHIRALSVDLTYKKQGSALQSEFYLRKIENSAFAEGYGWGFYTQPSFFLMPKKLEFAGRFSGMNESRARVHALTYEASAGINIYFFESHRNKLQINYGRLFSKQNDASYLQDHVLQVGLQGSI